MNYAIKQLETTENVLKDMIDGLAEFEVETQGLREKLLETQTAIMVLEANNGVIQIVKAQALNPTKK